MKKYIAQIAVLSLLATGMIIVPAVARGQNETSNGPSMNQAAPKPTHHNVIPFRGKVDAVDTKAMTLKVGNRAFQITADTKIMKNGQPATLSDAVAGEPVRGVYKKTDDGKLEAVSLSLGVKSTEKPKTPDANTN